MSTNVLFGTRRSQLVTLAARQVLLTIYSQREFAEAGALTNYGSSIIDRERPLGV